MLFPFLPLYSPVGEVTDKSRDTGIGLGLEPQDLRQADCLTLNKSINLLEPQFSHL